MLVRVCAAILAALSLFALQGCATKQSIPELPTTLGNNGLLVARLYVLGMQGMENASVEIDGKMLSSSLRDGYVAVSLEPGEHTLRQIRAEGRLLASNTREGSSPVRPARGGGAPRYIYVPGGSYTIHYTTLSVDRTFRIEPGKVTNLGLICYLPVIDDPGVKRATVDSSRQFRAVNVDNGAAIGGFLETNYPELVSTLKDREILLAPGRYLETAKLPDLRRTIAYFESRGPHFVDSPTRTAVYGRAGTIVTVSKPAKGEKPAVDVVDTGTLADIVGAARHGEKFTFLTSDAKLLSLDGKTLTQEPLPQRTQPILLRGLGEDGLLVIDNHLRIMTLHSAGGRWNSYEGAMTKIARNDVAVAPDKEGAYISLGLRGIPEAMYYLRAGEKAPRAIKGPEVKTGVTSADFHVLVARDAGLFMLFNRPDFYFWSKASQRWEVFTKPAGKCKPMKFDEDGRNIAIECDGVEHRSEDSGASWTRPQT